MSWIATHNYARRWRAEVVQLLFLRLCLGCRCLVVHGDLSNLLWTTRKRFLMVSQGFLSRVWKLKIILCRLPHFILPILSKIKLSQIFTQIITNNCEWFWISISFTINFIFQKKWKNQLWMLGSWPLWRRSKISCLEVNMNWYYFSIHLLLW